MDEQSITAKVISVVSVEPACMEGDRPAVALCIDDGSDRYHEYILTNLAEVRGLIALLLQALVHHGDPWAEEIYETHFRPEDPENP